MNVKNVFTTEQLCTDAVAVTNQRFLDSRPFNATAYLSKTTCWDKGGKRIDAEEWFYEVCPHIEDENHTQKESEPSWFPTEE